MSIEILEKNKSQSLSQQNFTLLLSKKYRKNYHIVDSPALSYSLARKSSQSVDIQNLKISKSGKQPVFGIAKRPIKRTIKNQTRIFYLQLKEQISATLQQIYSCLKTNKLTFAQIFEYNQVILKGYLEAYLQKLKQQCLEEGQFMRFIWNQTLKLMENIINIQQNQEIKIQKQGLQEIIKTHKSYHQTLEAQAKIRQTLKHQVKNLNQVLNYFVTKLRINKKQIRKIYKSQTQLISKLNQFKDQTIDSQLKYLQLKLQSEDISQKQINQYLEQKNTLIKYRNQLIKLEENNLQRIKQIQHQIHMEGKVSIQNFVKSVGSAINVPMTPQEIQAKIEEAFQELQQQFEEREFRMRKVAKKYNRMKTSQVQTLNKAIMVRPQDINLSTAGTQTTYSDKYENCLINSIGINAGSSDLQIKLKYKNQYAQCNTHLSKIETFNGSYQRVIQLSFHNQQIQIREPELENIKEIFKINYIQKNNQHRKNSFQQKLFSHKLIQCDENDIDQQQQQQQNSDLQNGSSIFNQNKFNFKHNHKKRELSRKSRFYATQQTNNQNSKLIKARINKERVSFGNVPMTNSPKIQKIRSISKGQNYIMVRKKSTLVLDSREQNISAGEGREHKQVSIFCRNKRQSNVSIKSSNRKIQERFTSLSRKTQVILPNNLQQILKNQDKNQKVPHNFGDFEQQKFEPNQLKQLLQQLSDIFSSDSDKQEITLINNFQQNKQMNNKSVKSVKEKKLKSNNILQQKTQRRRIIKDKTIIDNMLNKIVYKKIKVNKQNLLKKLAKSKLLVQEVEPVANDVRKKIMQCTFKTKKIMLPVKHNNMMTIISSVFSKSWEKLNNNILIRNFLGPLFETMNIVYGKLPEAQIYKKIINLIAQLSLQNDKICQCFIFFLAMDDNNPFSKQVTSFETYLFLKLVTSLSKTPHPFKQIDTAYTTVQILQNNLKKIFQAENLPDILDEQVLSSLKASLDMPDKKDTKIGLYYGCKRIIELILSINKRVGNIFQQFIDFSSQGQPDKGVDSVDIKIIVQCQSVNKIEQMKDLKKLYNLKPTDSSSITSDQFISFILRLKFLSFQDLYVRILNKFHIKTFEALRNIQSMKIIYNKFNLIPSKVENYKKIKGIANQNASCQNRKGKQKIISQISDIYLLNYVQKTSQKILEMMLGRSISKIYGLSLILLH